MKVTAKLQQRPRTWTVTVRLTRTEAAALTVATGTSITDALRVDVEAAVIDALTVDGGRRPAAATRAAKRTAKRNLIEDVRNVDLTPTGPFYFKGDKIAVGIEGGGFYIGGIAWVKDAEFAKRLTKGWQIEVVG